MVGLKTDQSTLRSICKVDYRSHLGVVRKACSKDNIAVFVSGLNIFRLNYTVVLPLRDWSFDEAAPRLVAPLSELDRWLEIILICDACVVADIGF